MLPMEWLFSWEVTSWAVGILTAFALGLLALNDYRWAKLFFLIAAADASGGVVMWGIKTETRTWPVLLAVAALMGGIGVLTVLAFWYVDGKKSSAEAKSNPKAATTIIVSMTKDQFDALMAAASKPAQLAQDKTSPKHQETKDSLNSDLQAVFYGKDQLYFEFKNPTQHVATQPTIGFGLMDFTNPYSYSRIPGEAPTAQPFPIPTRSSSDDYVRPVSWYGNQEILVSFMSHVKRGDVVFGVAWLTCKNCIKQRAYYVYWKVGTGGWYAEADPTKLQLPAPRMQPVPDAEINQYVDKLIPSENRKIIQEGLNR